MLEGSRESLSGIFLAQQTIPITDMVHYREVSPPANNVATSHYGHHQQWNLPQRFGDLKQSTRLRTSLIRLIVNTYTKPGQSSFRVASVVTLGIDEPSHQPDSPGN